MSDRWMNQVTVEQTATDVFMAAKEMAFLCGRPELTKYLSDTVQGDLESAERAIQKALGYIKERRRVQP